MLGWPTLFPATSRGSIMTLSVMIFTLGQADSEETMNRFIHSPTLGRAHLRARGRGLGTRFGFKIINKS